MKTVISGASGLVGMELTGFLRSRGHVVVHLVRPGSTASPGDIRWDPESGYIEGSLLEDADAVINLNGANVGTGRWTKRRKEILKNSRLKATRVLVDALAARRRKPPVLVSASAIGYYGDRGDEILTESSGPGPDFLSALAQDWETEAIRAERFDVRAVILRFGVILSVKGGALPRMLTPFQLGLGARIGSGRQWMSWTSLEDSVEVISFSIENKQVSGPVNVVSPNPVRNLEFTRVLANLLGGKARFAVPGIFLRLALGEMADSLLLASQRVHPERLLATGYRFRFTDLAALLRSLLAR